MNIILFKLFATILIQLPNYLNGRHPLTMPKSYTSTPIALGWINGVDRRWKIILPLLTTYFSLAMHHPPFYGKVEAIRTVLQDLSYRSTSFLKPQYKTAGT